MKKEQKVLLINAEETRSLFDFKGIIDDEPLELEVIYTALKNAGIKVEIFDLIRETISLEDKIKTYKPTITYTNGVVKQVPFLKEYNKRIKNVSNKKKTIIGGVYAEHNYEKLYSNSLDYVCRSYDPNVIVEIVKYENKEKINLNKLNGLCYKNDKGKWINNKIEPFDINTLPLTDRTYFYEHINEFRYLELTNIAQIRTSYSCPYKCKFCYRTSLNCGNYVAKDIEKVVEEIENIKTDNIYIVDDDFMFNKSRLKKFIKLIKERNIKKKYVAYGRVDFIIKNKDIIKELKEIGFYYLLVGLESITDNYLDSYNKYTGVKQNEECINFLNSINLNCMGMLIVDLNFTKKDFTNMYKWIKKTGIKHVALSIFTPLPGSELYKEYEDKLITDDLTKFDYIHLVVKPTKISIKKYYLYYYILVFKLFNLAKKYGIYDFMDWGKLKRDFFTLLTNKK